MRFYVLASAVGAAVLFSASSLSAQNPCTANPCTVTNTASATVANVVSLQLDHTTTDLGTPVLADFNAHHKDAATPVTATVQSNRAWSVVVGAAGPFTCTGSGCRTGKPASDVSWGTDGSTYGSTFGGSPAALYNGAATASAQKSVYYRTAWDFTTDTPGTYSLVVSYTLSAP